MYVVSLSLVVSGFNGLKIKYFEKTYIEVFDNIDFNRSDKLSYGDIVLFIAVFNALATLSLPLMFKCSPGLLP